MKIRFRDWVMCLLFGHAPGQLPEFLGGGRVCIHCGKVFN